MFISNGPELAAMRFIIRAQLPTAVGNKMMENPNSIEELEGYIKNINAENAYFFEANGDRTMVFIANMERADQMAMFAEPLFALGAKVEFHPVMVLEDLKKIREGTLVTKSIS